jgi:uncharacterized membrane protein YdjX (TVP38/TMEM64 family)
MHINTATYTHTLAEHKTAVVATVLMALAIAMWPLANAHMDDIRATLVQMVRFCHKHHTQGYFLFGGIFLLVVLVGLPMSMILMMLAGMLYGVWEATALVTACRMAGAGIGFFAARKLTAENQPPATRMGKVIRHKIRRQGAMYLFLLRILPFVPDSVVSYGMGTVSVKWHTYLWVSFLGMLPLSIACVALGHHIGNLRAIFKLFL